MAPRPISIRCGLNNTCMFNFYKLLGPKFFKKVCPHKVRESWGLFSVGRVQLVGRILAIGFEQDPLKPGHQPSVYIIS